jgi:phosphopantothenoylcysteine decarboxylase/phosphopantothenate--cysteine ligase
MVCVMLKYCCIICKQVVFIVETIVQIIYGCAASGAGAAAKYGGLKMNKKILLGVTGSIAAYKSAEIASGLVRTGYDVNVVMTSNAANFITPLTFETLTKNKVYMDMFQDGDYSRVAHIALAVESDLVLIAPASYNIIGKAAAGIADDLLSSILAAAPCSRVMFAPAMNANMYINPANIENIRKLKDRGCIFIEPEEGLLACGDLGKGRLRNVAAILERVDGFFCEKLLKGRKVMITAGATREYLDPIRFISNTSSGLMGLSLAKACRDMGADVVLILANSQLEADGIRIIRVNTTAEMRNAALDEFEDCNLVFAAAAVADYKPKEYSPSKIKKFDRSISINFEQNIDILFELGRLKKKQVLVGFAAESEDIFKNALAKLKKKNLDMIIANDLSNFSAKDGKVWIVSKNKTVELERKPKAKLAYDIVQTILADLHSLL